MNDVSVKTRKMTCTEGKKYADTFCPQIIFGHISHIKMSLKWHATIYKTKWHSV